MRDRDTDDPEFAAGHFADVLVRLCHELGLGTGIADEMTYQQRNISDQFADDYHDAQSYLAAHGLVP